MACSGRLLGWTVTWPVVDAEIALAPVPDFVGVQGILDFPLVEQVLSRICLVRLILECHFHKNIMSIFQGRAVKNKSRELL